MLVVSVATTGMTPSPQLHRKDMAVCSENDTRIDTLMCFLIYEVLVSKRSQTYSGNIWSV